MKEFLLIFRADLTTMPSRTPEQMQEQTRKWMDWIGGIAARDKLKDRGNRLMPEGKVLRSESLITDGPYMEIKESILGYSVIKAISWETAVEIAKGCPIFKSNGSVEVREISIL
jgi:hypothetical protein